MDQLNSSSNPNKNSVSTNEQNESEQSSLKKYYRRRPIFWLVIIVIIIIVALLLYYFLHPSKKRPPSKPTPVVTAVVRKSDVPVNIPALGQVTALYSVTVRTQVNGTLLKVYFREGQMVKAGQLIAEIDPRTFEAQLMQFEGDLARDAAQLANARVDLIRYKKLYPIGAVSQQVYATQAALVRQLEGTVKFDEGQIYAARVNLGYCWITSKVDGRIGLRLVDPGNFVQTTDTNGLVIIDTIKPITVVFTIPEDDVPQVLRQINTNKTLAVKAYDRQQNQLLSTGTLLAIDSQIDLTTGTLKLKASFANQDANLFPNQFVNVELLVDTLHGVTVVPTAAVQHGPQGTFVFLINKDQKVNVRPVTIGITSGNDTVITSGVSPGQTVVIDGESKLTDGTTVTEVMNQPLPSMQPAMPEMMLPMPTYQPSSQP